MIKLKSNKIKAEILGIADIPGTRDAAIEALWTITLRRRPNLKLVYESKVKPKKAKKS
jgi:hypothetical protein